MSFGHHRLDRDRMEKRLLCRELADAVGAALSIPQSHPGAIPYGPARERLRQALKALRAAS